VSIRIAWFILGVTARLRSFKFLYYAILRIGSPLVPRFDPASDVTLSLLRGTVAPDAIAGSLVLSLFMGVIVVATLSFLSALLAVTVFLVELLVLVLCTVIGLSAFSRLTIFLKSAITEFQISGRSGGPCP
jgi:hypothetical protein